jgi:hypothetical protein
MAIFMTSALPEQQTLDLAASRRTAYLKHVVRIQRQIRSGNNRRAADVVGHSHPKDMPRTVGDPTSYFVRPTTNL